jgi:fused signal recognition particle receptor
VILVVGVNGAGKTTTIGKLAKKLQLKARRSCSPPVTPSAPPPWSSCRSGASATDPGDRPAHRRRLRLGDLRRRAGRQGRNIDVLIADTAGRLHTKDNLMEELKKVRRVIGKLDAEAPHEVLLVLDAGTGQNAISQAKQLQPERRADRPGPDQARRHRQGRGDLRPGQAVQHSDPLHRCR